MNYLFVCTQNRWRSLTAEKIFSGNPGISVRSAGTASNARIKVVAAHVVWADLIFVMERKHQEILKERFPHAVVNKTIICLNIPDEYVYMDEELVKMLKAGVSSYLDR